MATRLIAGKYELVAPVGEGGMASVWKGLLHGAAGFQKPVAIKRVHSELSKNPSFTAMFVEEARVVSSLQHPNIVQVHDFDTDESGAYFIVMDWIDGLDMAQWVKAQALLGKPAPWHLVAGIMVEVLRAVSAAHERVDIRGNNVPVIHRDINPANIMLGASGHVKLADFGLARAMDRVGTTKPGVVKGKLAYLAPELLKGKQASRKSDLFGVGIVLWETLTGRRLFWAKNDGEVILNLSRCEVPPLAEARPDLPTVFADIVHTALAADPDERYDSAEEMLRNLTAILRHQPLPTDARPIAQSVQQARDVLAALPTRAEINSSDAKARTP